MMPALGDTAKTMVGTGGSITTQNATAVGFNSQLDPGSLVINGQQVTAKVGRSKTSLKLDRTITGASTLTLSVEDPDGAFLNSPFASITAPIEPITVVSAGGKSTAPTYKPTRDNYYPTTASLTDGTTTLTFALVEVQKQGYTVTLTFEDQLVNQLRYCWDPSGYNAQTGNLTRADIMAKVITQAMRQLSGNVLQPTLVYPTAAELQVIDNANPAASTATDLVWGSDTDPDQDAWSFLVQAANDAQWRCFSTGTAIVFGPDAWLLSGPVAVTVQQYQNGVGFIDFDWDIGQPEATCTVNCFTGDALNFTPGSVVQVTMLGVANGLWLVSDMSRELHLPDCTVTLAQAQPALTEALVAASVGTVSTVQDGTNAAGQSTTVPTVTNQGESAAADKAVAFALAQIGKPYIWGGTGPEGYDCSGLTQAAYAAAGVTIPRTSQEQAAAGFVVVDGVNDLIPGDLVFYAGSDGTPSAPGHVVMYIGNGECVQAEETGTDVMITSLPAGAVAMCRPAPNTDYGPPVSG